MRLNRYIALALGISRRKADELIERGSVRVSGRPAVLGQRIEPADKVTADGQPLALPELTYVVLNKPPGYVASRRQQGETPTIYALLPPELHGLKPVGRLDKDSSGLLLLTNDGELAQQLLHPSYQKTKVYHVRLNRPLAAAELERINRGIKLEDGVSRLSVTRTPDFLEVTMSEGKNRQIRRSFATLGYEVTYLHRVAFGQLTLGNLKTGAHRRIRNIELGLP